MHFARLLREDDFVDGTPIETLPALQFRGAPYGHKTALPLGSNHPVSLSPQFAYKLKRASVRTCTGPHGVPVNMQFATNLLMEMAGAACTIFRHSRRLRPFPYAYACAFLIFFGATQPATAANQQETTQETDKSRQSPERPVAQPTLESTEDWKPPHPRTNGFGRFNGQDESA